MPDDPADAALLVNVWHPDRGDRRQELVLIGQDMDEADLRARLDACLLTDAEMELGPEGWAAFDDPFGDWMLLPDDKEDEEDEDSINHYH
ncbi:MAG: GTP-binding protein [Chloroflexaceae bacterium]